MNCEHRISKRENDDRAIEYLGLNIGEPIVVLATRRGDFERPLCQLAITNGEITPFCLYLDASEKSCPAYGEDQSS